MNHNIVAEVHAEAFPLYKELLTAGVPQKQV